MIGALEHIIILNFCKTKASTDKWKEFRNCDKTSWHIWQRAANHRNIHRKPPLTNTKPTNQREKQDDDVHHEASRRQESLALRPEARKVALASAMRSETWNNLGDHFYVYQIGKSVTGCQYPGHIRLRCWGYKLPGGTAELPTQQHCSQRGAFTHIHGRKPGPRSSWELCSVSAKRGATWISTAGKKVNEMWPICPKRYYRCNSEGK